MALGINPFDQPNVQESKEYTNALLAQVRGQGALPAEPSTVSDGCLQVYDSEPAANLSESLGRFFAQVRPGDYIALMAFLTEQPQVDRALTKLRSLLHNHLGVPTTMGYGPRFLHSTGQMHKGGPESGVFLQLTADDIEDVEIPGASYGFGVMRRAQAAGDLQALARHRRRVLRVHLGADIVRGLESLIHAADASLAAAGIARG